jgi:hypothetical protein
MNHYIPQARSLAHQVCKELAERPRAMTASEISKMFGVPSGSVNASLRACVAHGALITRTVMLNGRKSSEYFPPGFEPPTAAAVDSKRTAKALPLDIVLYHDGEIHVRGHLISADAGDDGLAIFSPKQMAYLVARVCTPIIEVTP